MTRVDERQLRAERAVEVGERRHHLQDDDRDQDERQRRSGSPDRPAPRPSCASPSRRSSRTRRSAAAPRRGCRCARRPAATPCRRSGNSSPCASNASDSAVPDRTRSCTSSSTRRERPAIVTRRLQQVERLHQRHAGLEQRRQLLVEDQELAGGDALALRQPQRDAGDGALGLQREDEQPLLLELVAQPGFALGDVDAFDDLAAGRREPAAEFHRSERVIVSTSARSP